MIKNLPANAGDARDVGSIPGLGRSPGGGHGNPLQCSCLENPMDRGAWQATVHGVTQNCYQGGDMTEVTKQQQPIANCFPCPAFLGRTQTGSGLGFPFALAVS